MLSRGRNLDLITSVEVIERFVPLQSDVERLGHASHMIELINRLTEEQQELPAVFDLLTGSLAEMSEAESPVVVARYFELALLTLIGYRVELYSCPSCGETIREETNYLSSRSGGVLCPVCRTTDASARPISVNAQKFLRMLDRGGLPAVSQLKLPQSVHDEVEAVLTSYVRAIAERELTSLRVLRELNTGPTYQAGESV